VRGGLVFTAEIVITPRRQLRDARLFLDNGWFQGMTFNAVAPQPSAESAQGRWQVWGFGKIPAATAFHVWISWQVNPTNIGRHSQAVALYDGGTLLMGICSLGFGVRGVRPPSAGEPIVVVEKGKIIERNMRRERLTLDDLAEKARISEIESLDEVKWAVLETNGDISFIKQSSS